MKEEELLDSDKVQMEQKRWEEKKLHIVFE